MGDFKFYLGLGILAIIQSSKASPSPSIDLLLARLSGSNQTTTPSPSISDRIQSSLNNVLRLPLFGSEGNSSQLPHEAIVAAVVQPLNTIGDSLNQQNSPSQDSTAQSQNAPPSSFLPDVDGAVQSTIAQLSTLTHWPFAYETVRPLTQVHEANPTTARPVQTTTTARTRTTTTGRVPVTARATKPPPPPPPPTRAAVLSQPRPLPSFSLPPPQQPQRVPNFSIIPLAPQGSPFAQSQSPGGGTSPSLPERIHNRIQNRIESTLGNLRLPNLSQIGQPRPRPMLTEPPWVTELLGPTLEPPTTRAPTLGERVHNAVSNVVLFVPATLLNFWYETWGTQHVDRIISRLQVPTQKPGSPMAPPVFATISNSHPGPNPFANFTMDKLNNSSSFPAIAAFINANGTIKPTIVHPVVNMTSNTIEYQLRQANETTVLWTGTLSNDIFFGSKKTNYEEEDDEDEQQIKNNYVYNIRL